MLLICVADTENMISYPSTDDEIETPVNLFNQIFMRAHWNFLRTETHISYFCVLSFVYTIAGTLKMCAESMAE